MEKSNKEELKKLYIPAKESHKGQNGKLMIIGGSHLFHGASLWALKVASRIVDMVFYASVPENNALTERLKGDLYDFIAIPRGEIDSYIEEADVVLLGPGMLRAEKSEIRISKSETNPNVQNLNDINEIEDEGEQSYYLTKYLLQKYPNKKWVIDAGAMQMMEPEWLRLLKGNVVITPHHKEFEMVFHRVIPNSDSHAELVSASQKEPRSRNKFGMTNRKVQHDNEKIVGKIAQEFNCVILLKGAEDIICSPNECVRVEGGNVGMTKGGTGDVLAGLVAALACKNDLFLAAKAGSYINKKAGEELAKKVGIYFNASDLADEIPKIMVQVLGFSAA